MMNKQQIIEEHLGGYLVRGKSYHSPLSPTLAGWYCYTSDGGHSLLCLLQKDAAEAIASGNPMVSMLPVPVKSVVRDYELNGEFIVVDLPYSPVTGLNINDEDEEF